MRGLFDKFSCHPDTKRALVHELDGHYLSAKERYEELLSIRDRVEDGEDSWEAGKSPTPLEEDLWEDGYEESMKKAHLWGELAEWCEEKVGKDSFDQDIWNKEHRRLLHIHLDRLIGACSISSPTARSSQGVAMSGEHVFCAVLAVDYFEKFARHARKRSRHAMPTCAVDRPFDRKGPVTTGEGLGVLSVVAEDI